MKFRFAALAVGLALSSVGCTAIRPGAGCGDEVVCGSACAGHVVTSQMAPRASGLSGRHSCGLMAECGVDAGSVGAYVQDACGCNSGYGICNEASGLCNEASGLCQKAWSHRPKNCEAGFQAGVNRVLGGCGGCSNCPACDANYNFDPGPPVGQTAYPYYTTRGPRDFLMANPPSIGPR